MPDENIIEQLPKGALPDPVDERDYKVEAMGALPPVDWSQEFRLPAPPDEDQGSSDSCVAQSWSYYHWQLHGNDYSRRDLFARIAQSYGAVIRDGGLAIIKQGQATRDEVPDPQPETYQNMRDKTGITAAKEASDQELNSFVVPNDIDNTAAAIKAYGGVVFGVTGSNPGWQDMTNPRPPQQGETTWGHALYLMGYHLHNGVKCVIAKSSWCNYVKEHHIKANYFESGNTFNPWTLIPKGQQTMSQVKVAVIHGEGGIFLAASSQEEFAALCKVFGKDPSKPDVTV